MQIEVDGIEEVAALAAVLEALPGTLDRLATEEGLLEAAEVIRDEAKANAPEGKTGNLRRSIRARRGTRRYKPSVLVMATAPHAHLVELGTVKSAARPFMEPAAINTKSAQLRAFAKGVRKNFNKVERELKGKIKVSRRTARGLAE